MRLLAKPEGLADNRRSFVERAYPADDKMNLEQLRLMAQIAEHGSLTRAAIAANSQQSVISRQLSALEAECGGRLFYRTGRGVMLTELGASVMPRIKQLLTEFDQLAEDMRSSAEVPSGDVRLGILPALADPLVTLLYHEVREKLPLVHLHLYEGSNGQLEEWLTSGRIDLALYYRYGQVDESNDRVLGKVHAYLISAAGDAVTKKGRIPFRALENLPLILPSAPNALRTTLDQLARRENVNLSVAMEADSLPIQKDVVAAGNAYAIVGRLAISREMQAGTLQAARIVEPTIERAAILAATAHHVFTRANRAIARIVEPLAIKLLSEHEEA